MTFDADIKPLFRPEDRESMEFAFDLWSYADVSEHAEAILGRLQNGSMPCDGAWPGDRIAVFRRWIEAAGTVKAYGRNTMSARIASTATLAA